MRYTSRDAKILFQHLAKAFGKEVSQDHIKVGAWRLDNAPCYGGYIVEEFASDRGAISHPFGEGRRTTKEFCKSVNFLLNGLTGKRIMDEKEYLELIKK